MTRMQKRVWMAVLGVLSCGLVVAMMRTAGLGTDPYTVFMLGLANLFHSTYSTVYLITTGALLVVTFLLDRKFIGFATVINLFLIGVVCDGCMWVFAQIHLAPTGIVARAALLLGALGILCVSSSLYFTADLGVSAYDAMALIAAKRKLAAFRVCRISTDLFCVVAGALMGATVGVGTVLVALCMGPIVQWLNRVMSEPYLNGAGT